MNKAKSNQVLKSVRDFTVRFVRSFWNEGWKPVEMPTPPLVLRVAVAGHLQVSSPASLQHALAEIFSGLKAYAQRINEQFELALSDCGPRAVPREPELRILCQLAQGVDQMAAATALQLGYSLHAVLPGDRTAVERDIRSHSKLRSLAAESNLGDPVKTHRELLAKAVRVLELDQPPGDEQYEMSFASYTQASSVMLDHSDVVVVVLHDDASGNSGGTKWMEKQAEGRNLPVIRVPMDQPSQATLVWTNEGRRESRSLFNASSEGLNPSIFDSALSSVLLNRDSKFPFRSGWFENRMIGQLDPTLNNEVWDERWRLPGAATSLAEHSLGNAIIQIDSDLKAAKVWADHRASAMANLVRGSFILCSILGSLAVCGAILGVIVPSLSNPGKVFELSCLILILCFIHRSIRWNWKVQWLSLRQLERSVEQAAWLLTIGRVPSFTIPAHAREFQDDAHSRWANWYLRSALRAASFPSAQLDIDYVMTVEELASNNLIRNQINYFESEAEVHFRADEVLETWMKRCILLAVFVTFAYLTTPYAATLILQFNLPDRLSGVLGELSLGMPKITTSIATTVGATMPALAAALAAIRSHGEYAQIAARYQGTSRSLHLLEDEIGRRLPDGRRNRHGQPLRSAEVAELLLAATTSLFQEVISWQSMLRTKEIEPV
jgi:hypothetical protein